MQSSWRLRGHPQAKMRVSNDLISSHFDCRIRAWGLRENPYQKNRSQSHEKGKRSKRKEKLPQNMQAHRHLLSSHARLQAVPMLFPKNSTSGT